MSSCQICGKEADELTKIKVEGTKMGVCEDCENLGTKVDNSKSKSTRTKKSSTKSRNSKNQKVLVNNYGQKLRSARENKNLSQAELADKLNEKESFISKIEREDMKPPKKLAKKLETELGLELYVKDVVTDPKYKNEDSNSSGKTIGDVADLD